MGRNAVVDLEFNGTSFKATISIYSSEDGKLISREEMGKESEVKQVRIKDSMIITGSLYPFKISIVVEEFNGSSVKGEVLNIF
jgi:hypothetical protein